MSTITRKKRAAEFSTENPDPIDIHVGSRLKMRRNLIGLSQSQLGAALGLTFQQIQKYERGINRMGSSRLYNIARFLSVPISYFFEDMESAANRGFASGKQEELQDSPLRATAGDVLQQRETLELIRAYYKIQDVKQRRKVYELIRSMSEEV